MLALQLLRQNSIDVKENKKPMEAMEISETEPYMYDHLTYDRDGTDIIFQKVLMWKNLVSFLHLPPSHTYTSIPDRLQMEM